MPSLSRFAAARALTDHDKRMTARAASCKNGNNCLIWSGRHSIDTDTPHLDADGVPGGPKNRPGSGSWDIGAFQH
jgi:hypothetical protein